MCAVDITEVDAALDHLGCRAKVLTLDPMTMDEVESSIGTVGRVTGHDEAATELMAELRQRIDAVRSAVAHRFRPRTAVLEWTDPPFASGHWVPDMVVAAGGTPTLGSSGTRSFEVGWDDVAESAPDVIVVAPCGFDLEGARSLAKQLVDSGHLPGGVPVWAVDANAAFARPGPRVVDGVEALAGILHPGLLPSNEMMAVAVSPKAA